MIPKIIHYCWFGGNPKPKLAIKCLESWKNLCPDYEIIEWNEDNFDLQVCPKYVQQAYDAKKWAFVTDYVRLKVVYDVGGIYLDTDVELIQSLDQLLYYDAFFGFENQNSVNTGLGFGAIAGEGIVYEIMRQYSDITFLNEDGTMDQTPCPERNTEALVRYGLKRTGELQIIDDNVAVFPTDFFCPMEYGTGKLTITKNTVSIHHYESSWQSKEEKESVQEYFKSLPRQLRRNRVLGLLKRIIGEKNYRRIVLIRNKITRH